MTTITRERLKQIYAECEERDPTIFEIRELVRIALASLEAEPVAWEVGGIFCHTKEEASIYVGEPEPLYEAPPAPVVGGEYGDAYQGAREDLAIWKRRALEAESVSQTYNLPELIEGMEVSIDVSTCDADAGNRYFGTVTEVSELDTAKNGYILLVQDAKPNFDVNGNSPVQSPIDHGYRPECECSGCKATARICAELNNEEAEIFADGYNAAMLKVNKNASTELPNDANLSTNSPVIPDGYALVPVEPTDEMIAAAMNCEDVLFNSDESFCVQFGNIYEAMLAAAPQPEENNE